MTPHVRTTRLRPTTAFELTPRGDLEDGRRTRGVRETHLPRDPARLLSG